MKTVLVCHKCGCGFTEPNARGQMHAGPVWQWPLMNQFGPACGGIIEAKIITEGSHDRGIAIDGRNWP